MIISFTIPGRTPGKARPRGTIIRPNAARDAARAEAFAQAETSPTIDWRAVFGNAWDAAWKAACSIGFISEYTPKETKEAERNVRDFGRAAMCGRQALEGPIWLSVLVQQIPPPSWPRRKREAARYITTKPDGDNQLKLILDALNGVCWQDDAHIAAFMMLRVYSLEGPEQTTISFDVLNAERLPVPEWAPKALPLFEGIS